MITSRKFLCLLLFLLLGGSGITYADAPPAASPSPPAASPSATASPQPRKSHWSASGNMRVMPEVWNFFGAGPKFFNNYTFVGIRLQGRLKYDNTGLKGLVEVQDVQLLGLPGHAIAPLPAGPLGTGAAYFTSAQHEDINTLGVRQAYLTVGQPAHATFQFGRFDYFSGAEAGTPSDSVLAWLKTNRINERLIGAFGYTNYMRSYDGGRLDVDSREWHASGFVAAPTQGGFEPHFGTQMDNVLVSDLAFTVKPSPLLPHAEGQVFWNHYDDDRNVPQVDNRPAKLKGKINAEGGLHLDTLGFHYVTRIGRDVDGLAWFAYQTGKWGTQSHSADAFALELGWRPPKVPWSPWFRVGYDYYSGDGNPKDGQHHTFYTELITARVYARFPFYTNENLHDAFAQVILSPGRQTKVRGDLHFLSLDSSKDFWYAGGGPTQNGGFINGYTGRASGGSSDLAKVLDLSIQHDFDKHNSLIFYAGEAFGGSVIKNIYPGKSNATFFDLEYNHLF